jgi:hypothetical protein
MPFRAVTEMWALVHSGHWAKATTELSLAMLQSSREHCEIPLSHQVPTFDVV